MSVLATLRAQVRRRLLITYRVDPAVAASMVPAPLRPQLVNGSAVAGVCMIGLTSVRPGWLRPRWGFRTENVAHRVAVEWDQDGGVRTGVFIVERHSSSLIPVLGGGRLFPGVQRRGRFTLDEVGDRFRVRMAAPGIRVAVDVEVGNEWTSGLFGSVEEASEFHRLGSVGWSPCVAGDGIEALELTSTEWTAEPGVVHAVESSFFESLPAGSAVLDSALVMRDLPFFWDTPRVEFDEVAAPI